MDVRHLAEGVLDKIEIWAFSEAIPPKANVKQTQEEQSETGIENWKGLKCNGR